MENIKSKRSERQEEISADISIKVPDRAALIYRLEEINDDKQLQKGIHPYFLKVAGRELPPIAIAGIITMAVDRYTLGDRDRPTSQLVRMFVPSFVDAMVESPDGREAVRAILDGKL